MLEPQLFLVFTIDSAAAMKSTSCLFADGSNIVGHPRDSLTDGSGHYMHLVIEKCSTRKAKRHLNHEAAKEIYRAEETKDLVNHPTVFHAIGPTCSSGW